MLLLTQAPVATLLLAPDQFATALAEARSRKGLTQADVARLAGVSARAYQGYERGENVPPFDKARRLAEVLGIEAGNNPAMPTAADVSAETLPAAGDAYARPGADLNATVAVPQYGHVGAGNPRVPPKQIGVLNVTLAEYALDFGEPPRVIGDRYAPAGRFGYFIVDGDSAAPVYFDRERVPVQLLTPETTFANDLLYVFRWAGEYQIKRLRLLPGGIVRATSLNPSIDPFEFRVSDDEDFAVVALARASPKQELYTALVGRFLRAES